MIVAALIGCYLIGSIPQAWLIAKLVTGKDLRQMGSGNLGVTNTALSVARWAGLLVFLGELAKGMAAVLLMRAAGGSELMVALGLLAAVAGTRWSIWLGGAGGRGNTTGSGGLLLISLQILLVILVVWVVLRLITRQSFLATRISLLLWPLIFVLVSQVWWYAFFGAAMSLIYLDAQRPDTDDHSIVKERWPSLLAFLTSPRRK
ncbi:MAG TPA: glycerol-3-phosphate acyltransferase [Anaerolineae bacterium]|jgi:glycerol-3-phosphate acyltransferase PlsY|nr:glycerol-3-phosphate acyltransferase [Anaerolineae bacterium]